jgi:hypothetical protein
VEEKILPESGFRIAPSDIDIDSNVSPKAHERQRPKKYRKPKGA